MLQTFTIDIAERGTSVIAGMRTFTAILEHSLKHFTVGWKNGELVSMVT